MLVYALQSNIYLSNRFWNSQSNSFLSKFFIDGIHNFFFQFFYIFKSNLPLAQLIKLIISEAILNSNVTIYTTISHHTFNSFKVRIQCETFEIFFVLNIEEL